jgi:hypothetical protein
MTIPYVGLCAGSAGPPLEGTVEGEGDGATGVCPACSGRHPLRDGALAEHETTPQEERERIAK